MKLYLAFFENNSEFYQYSIHRKQEAAEMAARAMLMDEIAEDEDDAPDPGLSFEALIEWLAENNGHCVGVCLLKLEDTM